MANPLFNRFFGASQPVRNGEVQSMPTASNAMAMPSNGPEMTQMNMQDAMGQLRADPAGMLRKYGYTVPDEIIGNPQATVMHLIQSGQVGGPVMQKIQPMLNMLMGKR